MNILILSSFAHPKFIQDFHLGNYLIDEGYSVLISDINIVEESMDSVYDVVLFRNFVPHLISRYDDILNSFRENIHKLKNIPKCYKDYDPCYYTQVALELGIDTVEEASTGRVIAYGRDIPTRFILETPDSRFVCRSVEHEYYHTIVYDGKIVLTYISINGVFRVVEGDMDCPILNQVIDYIDNSVITEIIYTIEDTFRLSFIDSTYIDIPEGIETMPIYRAILSMITKNKRD